MVAYVSKTLLVIDGHSMAFRAFFALPVESFTSKGGQATNAVYGFLSMLVRLIDTEHPTHIAVAFDVGRETFRNREYPEYKGGRDETPAEFKGQVEIITELLHRMGIRTLTKDDFEADDILATLTREGTEAGFRVLLASGDRDTFQLVNDQVTVIYPGRSASDLKYMDPAAIEERYGVVPERYPEIAALVGESADNLPGVPGVGPKTAAQWLNKFDGLENLLAEADQVGGKRGEALREHVEAVRRNRRLNRLVSDLDLGVEVGDLVPTEADYQGLQQLFDALDFTGLRSRVYQALQVEPNGLSEPADSGEDDGVGLERTLVVEPGQNVADWLRNRDHFALAYSGVGRPAAGDLTGFALLSEGEALVVDPAQLDPAQDRAFADFFASDPDLVIHEAKAATHAFAARGWQLPAPSFETELAAYLCRPDRRGYSLSELAREYLGEELEEADEGALFSAADLDENAEPGWVRRLAQQALLTARLEAPLRAQLDADQMTALLTTMEIPMQRVLARMEQAGVAMDLDVLDELAQELAAGAARAQEDAFAAIGHEANLSSPKQLQVILFEELGMPKTRKTKTGWTTDAGALTDLFAKTGHPFLEALLRHRDHTKLGQMVEGLRAEVKPDGRIHTTFQQTVTATGRLASAEPNLQNIPTRTATGRRVRGAFICGPDYEALMSVDYSQIEMRIMAHLSEDQELIAAFNSGEDLHRTMASMVFGVPVSEITSELRSRIKATSYGLAYGLSPFGLSRQLGVGVDEARDLHSRYFERFGGVGRYLHEVVEVARQTGYTETMFGRRRYFPELRSDSHRVREMAERAALNAPIQGSAADIIKIATNDVYQRLRDGKYRSRLLLQIHDELLLEIAPGERKEVEELVRESMGQAAEMSVPLEVAVGVGRSWKDAAH
ncbi:DNA polymerase I [Actinomyces sp. F1_1611]